MARSTLISEIRIEVSTSFEFQRLRIRGDIYYGTASTLPELDDNSCIHFYLHCRLDMGASPGDARCTSSPGDAVAGSIQSRFRQMQTQ